MPRTTGIMLRVGPHRSFTDCSAIVKRASLATILDAKPSLSSEWPLQAMLDVQNDDITSWAGCYQLYCQWSADRDHPWDRLEDSNQNIGVLEIGNNAAGEDQAIVLLNGQKVLDYEFQNARFSTRHPVQIRAPTGQTIQVKLDLYMSIGTPFFDNDAASQPSIDSFGDYIGTECHGTIFPFSDNTGVEVPQGFSLVIGKVNVSNRASAFGGSPGSSLLLYHGEYNLLKRSAGSSKFTEDAGTLQISEGSPGEAEVKISDQQLTEWTFVSNFLKCTHQGEQVWLHFSKREDHVSVQGRIVSEGQDTDGEGVHVHGELKRGAPVQSPIQIYDPTMSRNTALNMNMAAIVLLGRMIDLATWTLIYSQESSPAQAPSLATLEKYGVALAILEGLISDFESVFALGHKLRRRTLKRAMQYDIEESKEAEEASSRCSQRTKVFEKAYVDAKGLAELAEQASVGASFSMCTFRSGQLVWKTYHTAQIAFEIQNLASKAAQHAENTTSFYACLAAQQTAHQYNQARSKVLETVKLALTAARTSQASVTGGIHNLAAASNFNKLKDIAEASEMSHELVASATKAVKGWEAFTDMVDETTLLASHEALTFSQKCYKITRRLDKQTSGSSSEDFTYGI